MTTPQLASTPPPAPTHPSPLIRVENLSKHFATGSSSWFGKPKPLVQAVSNVTLSLNKGEIFGLVGESGCGKSTLGRCILQLLKPTAGEVYFNQQALGPLSTKAMRPLRQQLQIVFQNPYTSLDPRMRIGDTLAEPFLIHQRSLGLNKPQINTKVLALLDTVGLPTTAIGRYPHEFSGGQRQRVGIARAIALNPQFIVADEPVSALDVSIQAQILNLLADLRQSMGLTMLFVAHNLGVIQYLSDRVGVMYLGNLVETAPTDQLFSNPLHPYTKALLASVPVANPVLARQRLATRTLLEGDLPSPSNPPSGCRFHTRCPVAIDRCRHDVPLLTVVEGDHAVACHLV
jgi:oligopeptide transport system ATP-binding protein